MHRRLSLKKWIHKSIFEKLFYDGFQEQAGASRILRQDNKSLNSLYLKVL